MAMIDDLVQHVSTRAGLPPEQARKAVDAAVEFLDTRVPPPFRGKLMQMAQGGGGGLAGGLSGLGSLFGGRK